MIFAFQPQRVARMLAMTGMVLATGLGPAGCGREQIQVYRVGKEAPGPSLVPLMPVWSIPEGWQELPPTELRVGNFRIPGDSGEAAEVSIIPIPARTGMELEVINLWRREDLGLKTVTAEELGHGDAHIQIGPGEGHLYELEGSDSSAAGKKVLAGVLEHDGKSWFFKMTGPSALVSARKEAFLEFMKGIRFEPGVPPTRHAPTMAGGGEGGDSANEAQLPAWELPEHWKRQAPGNMVLARFRVEKPDGGNAAVTVTSFPGSVGGLLENVNRWRREIGLDPVAAEDEAKKSTQAITLEAGEATLVDLAGSHPPAGSDIPERTVVAIVPRGGNTWFFKLRGPQPVVEAEKAAFLAFIKSIRFPNAS